MNVGKPHLSQETGVGGGTVCKEEEEERKRKDTPRGWEEPHSQDSWMTTGEGTRRLSDSSQV